ncbi:hypothetical protein KVT40_006885 [Elsinoe batatas]|uniref:Uncharacterized protein n=1 Tax=Elsinoe batatas TaxID=2601811 RepID=A0A8K0KYK8_9PEZI|nr:hypothetical protein KVT40_006885 [Elsinoe batatas]
MPACVAGDGSGQAHCPDLVDSSILTWVILVVQIWMFVNDEYSVRCLCYPVRVLKGKFAGSGKARPLRDLLFNHLIHNGCTSLCACCTLTSFANKEKQFHHIPCLGRDESMQCSSSDWGSSKRTRHGMTGLQRLRGFLTFDARREEQVW